jgi:hypothetical protein
MQGLSKPRRNPETTLLRSDDAGESKLLPLDEQLEQSSTSIGNLMVDDRDRKQAHTSGATSVYPINDSTLCHRISENLFGHTPDRP